MAIFYMYQLNEQSLWCPLLLHAKRNILERVLLLLLWLWFTTGIFLLAFHHAIQFLCHMTLLANVEKNFIFHIKAFQSTAKCNDFSSKNVRYPAPEWCLFQLTGHWGSSVVSFWQITDFNQSIDCAAPCFLRLQINPFLIYSAKTD